jgi:hypothetical protein
VLPRHFARDDEGARDPVGGGQHGDSAGG